MSADSVPSMAELITEAVADAQQAQNGLALESSDKAPRSAASASPATDTEMNVLDPDAIDPPPGALLLRRLSPRGIELWLAAVVKASVTGVLVPRGQIAAMALVAHYRRTQYGAFPSGESLTEKIGWREDSFSRGLKALRKTGLIVDGFHRQKDGVVRLVRLFKLDEKGLTPKDRLQLSRDQMWPDGCEPAIYTGKVKVHQKRLSSTDRQKKIADTAIAMRSMAAKTIADLAIGNGKAIADLAIGSELPDRQSKTGQKPGNMRVLAGQAELKRLPDRQSYEERDKKEPYGIGEDSNESSSSSIEEDATRLSRPQAASTPLGRSDDGPLAAHHLHSLGAKDSILAGEPLSIPEREDELPAAITYATSPAAKSLAPTSPVPDYSESTSENSDISWAGDPAFAEFASLIELRAGVPLAAAQTTHLWLTWLAWAPEHQAAMLARVRQLHAEKVTAAIERAVADTRLPVVSAASASPDTVEPSVVDVGHEMPSVQPSPAAVTAMVAELMAGRPSQ